MEKSKFKLAALPAFIHGKCPRCRRGDIFLNPVNGIYSREMNKVCPHCGSPYDIKSGYFYLAAIIKYTISVAEMAICAVTIHLLTGSRDLWLYFMGVVCLTIMLSPYNYRYSRIMLLHWLIPGMGYHPEMSKDKIDLPFIEPQSD